MIQYFFTDTSRSQNLFADWNCEQTFWRMVERIQNPIVYDKNLIDAVRLEYLKYKNESDEKTKPKLADKLHTYADELSVFNLSYIYDGSLPDESFSHSEYLTYYLEIRNGINEVRELLITEAQPHCIFKGHLGVDLIVIFKLCQPITDYYLYEFIFECYAEKLYEKIGSHPLNLDFPLATFFMSYDPDMYVNDESDLIHVPEILRSISRNGNLNGKGDIICLN
jgi:hypothetical protein